MHKISKGTLAKLVPTLLASSVSLAHAEVSISHGPTAIPDGEATHAQDLTVRNEHLAFSLAVESRPPWGVPRGTLVDLAAVKDGEIDLDRVAFADFIPNNWSAWPNERKSVEVVTDTPEQAVLKVSRNFGEVDVTTWYTLAAGSDRIQLKTTLTNQGDTALDLQSGFTLWPDTGYLFSVPGLGDQKAAAADQALSDRMVGYDRDWAFALHAPYFDRVNYQGRDMYLGHQLAPNQSKTFEGALQVVPNGDLAPIVKAEAERHGAPTGQIQGQLTARDGSIPQDGIVMIEKAGHPYAWTLSRDGQYQIELPAGKYDIYGTATGHANSARRSITVGDGKAQTQDFTDLAGPAKLSLQVQTQATRQAKDARITILEGQEPPVEFLGKQTFFTELTPAGHAELELAPGSYRFGIDAGAGFTAQRQTLSVSLKSGEIRREAVRIPQITTPSLNHWYGADLHHHANVLEGTTPPEMVVRAQLATGLDLTFVSDHDSTANHREFAALSQQRGVPFIPSIEISPSWGHMNPFPIDLSSELTVDPGTDSVHTLIDAARKMGATVVPMNHPYNPYGYFKNLENNKVPGGETNGFDLMELNAEVDNKPTLAKAHQLWDQGKAMYFTAGTDTHDAWNQLTGRIRMMAHVPGELTPTRFAQALKAGQGYATQGPILYPQGIMFGDSIAQGQAHQWPVSFAAANGLAQVRLIGQGGKVLKQFKINPDAEPQHLNMTLTIPATATGWVALEVEDKDGDTAWSNPVWLR